ncbi:MAG: peptidylprolyl isomerase [Acidimicrobiales bacterium]|nr:peptidylprolyl isomerase [Acidimicrobiales bacterium]
MPPKSSQRRREQARRQAQEMRRAEAARRARRNQRLVLIMAILVLTLFGGGMVSAARRSNERAGASTTSTVTTLSTTTTTVGTPVSVPRIPAGGSIDGPTPCPAEDGSSPRITRFSSAPPMCIDPDYTYNARIKTSVGDIVYLINPEVHAQTVNNFVVLARYHFYDGLPLTSIDPTKRFVILPGFAESPGASDPGYTIPPEGQEQVVLVGSLVVYPDGSGQNGGALQVPLSEEGAAGLPRGTTVFGVMLDGLETLQRIRKGGTPQTGQPTEVITIESISVEQSLPVERTTASATS